ncbi:MAG TPA: hypothetical protein VKQ32_09625 [Polyangia bacterium]|nr:hypothetical protein [Polyangia bacterium]
MSAARLTVEQVCAAYRAATAAEDAARVGRCRICGERPAFGDTGVCRWESCEQAARAEVSR